MTPNPVIHFNNTYQVARQDLKGIHSACESFLAAFLDQAMGPDVFALCEPESQFPVFAEMVEASGRKLTAHNVTRTATKTLDERGVLFMPGPDVAHEARRRSFLRDDLYAICGLTHAVSSRGVIGGTADLVTAPVAPWDAFICTSQAVHAALSTVLHHTEEDLRRRLGAARFTRPLMPVLPLGIHARRFASKPADRKTWRANLGIDDDAVAVLFFGRLSVHAKASPFQLAQALEIAARAGKTRFEMIWCGWFANDFQQKAFMETAQAMAPSVRFHHVDGRKAEARFSIWSAADIFCSLSDNIQESFGLTPIEAMAVGLPLLVSNWDGYRDAIEHGKNGILVDSYLPSVSMADAAYRYLSGVDGYDQYVGAISQFCVIDVEQTAYWLAKLGAEPLLRRRLGDAARHDAVSKYDWKAVLPRYRELWAEQKARLDDARRRGETNASIAWRALDPAVVFAGFPSQRMGEATPLARGPFFDSWEQLLQQPGIVVHPPVLSGVNALNALRSAFPDAEPRPLGAVLDGFAQPERPGVLRTIHWLVKIGLLRLAARRDPA